jgi:hypothetical protein
MPRLVTFGDSFTYGHGLSDCHVPPDLAGPNCSKLSWPQLLGDQLGIEVINRAKPGHSNIEILRDILNSKDMLPTDIIIVGWTYVVRDYVFKKNLLGKDISFKISPWIGSKDFIKKWFSVHNDYDLSVRAGLYIHHAECFLKTKELEQYHFCAYRDFFNVMPDFTIVPKNFISKNILPRIDKALDNSHPGPISHQQAAKNLYEILNGTK